jgi:hypothetical protein
VSHSHFQGEWCPAEWERVKVSGKRRKEGQAVVGGTEKEPGRDLHVRDGGMRLRETW